MIESSVSPLHDAVDLEEITISDALHVRAGETLKFENKIVHMQDSIVCAGKLVFDTCIIHYGERRSAAQIKLQGKSTVTIQDSVVEGHNLSTDEKYFISGNNDDGKRDFLFVGSEFLNCTYFLDNDGFFSFDHCTVHGICQNFIDSGDYYQYAGEVTQCIFRLTKRPSFIFSSTRGFDELHIIRGHDIRFSNNRVFGPLKFESAKEVDELYPPFSKSYSPYFWQMGNNCMVEGCTFEGVGKIFNSYGKQIIRTSVFSGCCNVLKCCMDPVNVEDCRFDSCSRVCNDLPKESMFLNCQFNDCISNVLSSGFDGNIVIQDCQFNGWLASGSMLAFNCVKESRKQNEVKRCTFNKINVHNGYAIFSDSSDDIGKALAVVEDCLFAGCRADRAGNRIYNSTYEYYGSFGRSRDCKANEIKNCSTVEGKDVILKTTTDDGDEIGAESDDQDIGITWTHTKLPRGISSIKS